MPVNATDVPAVAVISGNAAGALLYRNAAEGGVSVTVSSAVIENDATAGIVIVTTVSDVRTTWLASSAPPFTFASQPLASLCPESSPVMMFARWLSNGAPAAAQMLPLTVSTTGPAVPPIMADMARGPPDAASAVALFATVSSGVAIAEPDPTSADAGTVTVTVSEPVMA